MKNQTIFRWGFFAIIIILLGMNSYKAMNMERQEQKLMVANGVISEKLINSYTCGEYNYQCYDRYIVVDNAMHLVNESTYNNYHVGNSIKLEHIILLNENEFTIHENIHILTLIFLNLLMVLMLCRVVFWALFRSNKRKFKDYVIDIF